MLRPAAGAGAGSSRTGRDGRRCCRHGRCRSSSHGGRCCRHCRRTRTTGPAGGAAAIAGRVGAARAGGSCRHTADARPRDQPAAWPRWLAVAEQPSRWAAPGAAAERCGAARVARRHGRLGRGRGWRTRRCGCSAGCRGGSRRHSGPGHHWRGAAWGRGAGRSASSLRCWMAFRTSPGLDTRDQSIFCAAAVLALAAPPPLRLPRWKWARTRCASSPSSELECVFASVHSNFAKHVQNRFALDFELSCQIVYANFTHPSLYVALCLPPLSCS